MAAIGAIRQVQKVAIGGFRGIGGREEEIEVVLEGVVKVVLGVVGLLGVETDGGSSSLDAAAFGAGGEAPLTVEDEVRKVPVIGAAVESVRVRSRDASLAAARAAASARGDSLSSFGGMGGTELEFLVRSERADGVVQEAWRSGKEFSALHDALVASGHTTSLESAGVRAPVLDAHRSALSVAASLGGAAALAAGFSGSSSSPAATAMGILPSSRDRVEVLRAAADDYVRSLLTCDGARDDPSFRSFLRPALRPDWPPALGPIDLAVHDGPHFSSHTEWWYFNTHFEDAEGHCYSAFVAFFRALKHTDVSSGEREWGYAINWALSDVQKERYVQECALDEAAPEILKGTIEKGKIFNDARLQRAYLEVLEKGNVPLPDRIFSSKPKCAWGTLDLDFEFGQVHRDDEGRYHLKTTTKDGKDGIDFILTPQKAPVRHGLDGVVKGHDGDDMFYYLIPRCGLEGSFTVNGERKEVAKGQGWYDHEFGGHRDDSTGEAPMQYAWNWAAIQLDSGEDISVATLVDPRTKPYVEMERRAIVIDKDGRRSQPDDLAFRTAFVAPAGSKKLRGSDGAVEEGKRGEGMEESKDDSGAASGGGGVEDDEIAAEDERARRLAEAARAPMREEVRRATTGGGKKKKGEEEEEEVRRKRTEPLPADPWRSVRTFSEFPTRWSVCIPSMEIDLTLTATFDDQEFVTIIAKPSFWEGRVDVEGTVRGREVHGVGYIEVNGFNPLQKLTQFFKRVGEEVRIRVRQVYPDHPTVEDGVRLIADDDHAYYVDGVDMETIDHNLLKPIRHISDQGGKSWRSYGALACIEIVGGDSRAYRDWLAMPEFMHVGSLVVDDFQDKSELRRGVPCSHLVFGENVAINAGTAAYFQGQKMLTLPFLTDRQLVDVYDCYFLALRAGHAGQALDLASLTHVMDSALDAEARGDKVNGSELIERRVIAIHRLKTAVPAGALARIGAICGDADAEVIERVGRYFEAVGVAFQIMDDVLNLRGLYSTSADRKGGQILKTVGEDLEEGKVTMPVAKAMSRVPYEDMCRMWATIKSKPKDRKVIEGLIQELEDCGAIEACVKQAKDLVDNSWLELDAVVPDSFAKIMVRSFGWFVTQRGN